MKCPKCGEWMVFDHKVEYAGQEWWLYKCFHCGFEKRMK